MQLVPSYNIGALFLSADDCAQGRDVDVDFDNLKKFDGYWMAQTIKSRQPDVWNKLQAEYPDKVYGYYVSSFTTMSSNSKSFLNLAWIEANHPEWFLTDGTNRLRWSDVPGNGYYDRFFLDVGNPEFQVWAADQWLSVLQDDGFDVLVWDNVSLDVWSQWKTRTYPNWDYAGREKEAQWKQGFLDYVETTHALLHEHGKKLVLNQTSDYGSDLHHDDWDRLFGICDGLADECALGTPSKLWQGEQYEWSLKWHERIQDAGLLDWWICYPTTSDAKQGYLQFLYTYASFLLVRDAIKSNTCLFTTGSNQWFADYETVLGPPLDNRHRQNYVWYREFGNGVVAVNPTEQERGFSLEPGWTINQTTGNKKVTRIRYYMQPMSGLVIL